MNDNNQLTANVAAANTSGSQGTIPDEIKGWNWGAFFLNWIWGIGNGVWYGLLSFIPVFNIVWMFILGAKGNKWAWQNNQWESVAHFKRTQRKWAIAGVAIFLLSMWYGLIIVLAINGKHVHHH